MQLNLNIKECIQPVSDFRKSSAQILKKLKENHLPLILTQRGRSVAVMLDIDTYQKLEYESSLKASYFRGLDDIKKGKVVSHEQVTKRIQQKLHPK